jgi:PadR family transcriptional regulator, regulatory protein PadR
MIIILIYDIDNLYRGEYRQMKERVLRKLFLGFIQIHILYHAGKEPIYGVLMIDELERHGYKISAGTLYPILNSLSKNGLLRKKDQLSGGKIRKYYTLTAAGRNVLAEATVKAEELARELRQ